MPKAVLRAHVHAPQHERESASSSLGGWLARTRRRARGLRADWMKRLVRGAHRHECGNPLRARFRALRSRHPVENRIAIRSIQCLEEYAGSVIALERFSEVVRHGRRLRTVIRAGPPPITFGALNLSETWCLHSSACDERLGLAAVDFRPPALRRSRRESLQPGSVVERPLLAVDPSPAKGGIERSRVRERALGVLLRNPQKNTLRAGVIRAYPRFPSRCA